MQVGIRDLKNRLTHYLEMAKRGHAVIITDRGSPVAVLHNRPERKNSKYVIPVDEWGWWSFPFSFEPPGRAVACQGQ